MEIRQYFSVKNLRFINFRLLKQLSLVSMLAFFLLFFTFAQWSIEKDKLHIISVPNKKIIIKTSDGGFISGSTSEKMYTVKFGFLFLPCGKQYLVQKLGPNGSIEWERDFGTQGDDYLADISATNDGGFLLAGQTSTKHWNQSNKESNQNNIWIVKTDGMGNRIWDKHLDGPNRDCVIAIKRLSDEILITCKAKTFAGTDPKEGIDIWTISFKEDGTIQSVRPLSDSSTLN